MKAILVLNEMPKDCEHCMLVQRDYGNDYWCQFVGELEFDEMTKIHERCPLKKMPMLTEKELKQLDERFIQGWAWTIEEIEK